MANQRTQIQVEDILNISQATKTQLMAGINVASMIKTGVINQSVLPIDSILSDGDQVLIDQDGNVLMA
jgi:hypothetical protein